VPADATDVLLIALILLFAVWAMWRARQKPELARLYDDIALAAHGLVGQG
jgi:hypothetical protein